MKGLNVAGTLYITRSLQFFAFLLIDFFSLIKSKIIDIGIVALSFFGGTVSVSLCSSSMLNIQQEEQSIPQGYTREG